MKKVLSNIILFMVKILVWMVSLIFRTVLKLNKLDPSQSPYKKLLDAINDWAEQTKYRNYMIERMKNASINISARRGIISDSKRANFVNNYYNTGLSYARTMYDEPFEQAPIIKNEFVKSKSDDHANEFLYKFRELISNYNQECCIHNVVAPDNTNVPDKRDGVPSEEIEIDESDFITEPEPLKNDLKSCAEVFETPSNDKNFKVIAHPGVAVEKMTSFQDTSPDFDSEEYFQKIMKQAEQILAVETTNIEKATVVEAKPKKKVVKVAAKKSKKQSSKKSRKSNKGNKR